MKKEFDVIVRKEDKFVLRKALGYFKQLVKDVNVFLYRDEKYKEWYVIDVETGMAFGTGKTMAKSFTDGLNELKSFKEYKKTPAYQEKKELYSQLKSEGLYE